MFAKAWSVYPGEGIDIGIVVGPQADLICEPFEPVAIEFLAAGDEAGSVLCLGLVAAHSSREFVRGDDGVDRFVQAVGGEK